MRSGEQETLPPEVVSQLGYYVYALRDPTVDPAEVFYVGKGKGYRAFAHEHGVSGEHDTDTQAVKRAKNHRIRAIRERGGHVEHLFIRTELDGDAAFIVEQAVIDTCRAAGLPLTNLVRAPGSREHGLVSVDDLIVRLGAPPCPPLPEGTMLVKIPRWRPGMTEQETYDQTRQWWPIAAWRIPRITTLFGIVDGVIRSAYEVDPDGWRSDVRQFGTRKEPSTRWSCTGEATSDLDPYRLTHVRDVIDIRPQFPCRYPGW